MSSARAVGPTRSGSGRPAASTTRFIIANTPHTPAAATVAWSPASAASARRAAAIPERAVMGVHLFYY
jgi:hypothetical protein